MVWALRQEDMIREIYFRANRHCAALMLECADLQETERRLAERPLVAGEAFR